MKIKRNIAIGLGAIMIAGISIAGISHISANAQNKATTTTAQQATITESEARELMEEKVPDAEIIKFELEKDDGVLKYDGTLVKDNMEYDIDVDANTGKIISFEEEVYEKEDKLEDQATNKENEQNNQDKDLSDNQITETKSSSNYISREEAKKIMKNKAPETTLVDFEFDIDDGRAEYEGELVGNNIEYDIVLDAITGDVIEFEKDYDNTYDNDDRYDYDDDDKYDDDDCEEDDDRYDDED
ncbi:MAG: PepSY domain-containing protein [Intestinibacter sp.]